jgi:hypothetical protein
MGRACRLYCDPSDRSHAAQDGSVLIPPSLSFVGERYGHGKQVLQ